MNMGGVEKVHEVQRFMRQTEDTTGRPKAKVGIGERALNMGFTRITRHIGSEF